MTTARRLPDPATQPTITVAEAARILGIGRNQAYAAVERGEIPALRLGKSIRIPTALLLAALGLAPTGDN